MHHTPSSTIRRVGLAGAVAAALLAAGCANWPGEGFGPSARAEPLQRSQPMGAGPLLSEDPAYAPPRGLYGPGTVMPGGTRAP